MNDSDLRRFYRKNPHLFAGPIQTVIEEHYNIRDPNVEVPPVIQRLFMEADRFLTQHARERAEREDSWGVLS